jgi:hypothetical protein
MLPKFIDFDQMSQELQLFLYLWKDAVIVYRNAKWRFSDRGGPCLDCTVFDLVGTHYLYEHDFTSQKYRSPILRISDSSLIRGGSILM